MSREVSDILRFVSMMAVLVIHATGRAEHSFLAHHNFFSESFLSVIANQIARFSVPVFVFLSGYGLGMKYREGFSSLSDIFLFYRDRFVKIALPFLFITLLILSLVPHGFRFGTDNTSSENFYILIENLYYKNADYHLYFFTIILQCYLVFPLLNHFTQTWLLLIFYLPLFLLTYPGFMILAASGMSYPSWPAAALVYWLFYFHAGILAARHRDTISKALSPFSLPQTSAVVTALAILLITEYTYRSYHSPVPDYYNHFHRFSVQIYSAAVLALVFRGDGAIRQWLLRHAALNSFIAGSAALSFFIYIYHTWVLRLLEQFVPCLPPLLMAPVLFAVMYTVARLFDGLLPGKPALLRTILGLPAKNK